MNECNCPTRWLRWTMLWIFLALANLLVLIEHGIDHQAWKAAADTICLGICAFGIIGEVFVNRLDQ